MNAIPEPDKIRHARQLTLISYLLLLLSFAVNAALHSTPAAAVVFTFVPLLIFWPGLRKSRNRTLIWLCFVLCMYFFVVVGNIAAPNHHWLDWFEAVMLIVLFVAAFLLCRWQQVFSSNQGQQSAPELKD